MVRDKPWLELWTSEELVWNLGPHLDDKRDPKYPDRVRNPGSQELLEGPGSSSKVLRRELY